MALHPVIRGHGINGATSPPWRATSALRSLTQRHRMIPVTRISYTDPPPPKGNNTFVFRTNDFILQPSRTCFHLFLHRKDKAIFPRISETAPALISPSGPKSSSLFRRCQRGQSATGRRALGKAALWRQPLLFTSILPPFWLSPSAFYPNANSKVESHLVVTVTKLAKNRSFS